MPTLMPGRGQDAGQQAAGRRLAVGAGDADELQPMAGIAGQGLADAAIGISGIGRHAIGQAELWRRPLGKHGVAAASDRLGDELMAIAAAARQCGKEHSGPHQPRVAHAGIDANVVRAEPWVSGNSRRRLTTRAVLEQTCTPMASMPQAAGKVKGKRDKRTRCDVTNAELGGTGVSPDR